jgi:Lrp/AsnC family transcriptional regulator
MQKFISGVRDIPEIVEILRMSGDIDYLLKVDVPDIWL